MKKHYTYLLFIILIFGCKQTEETKQIEIPKVEPKIQLDSVAETVKEDDATLIKKIEDNFFENVKQYDIDNNENRTSRFRKLFKKYKISPYELYLEITGIYKYADDEARKVGVEIKANGSERITEKYYRVLSNLRDPKIELLKEKYGLDHDLFLQFENNFCFCYNGKEDYYCQDGNCICILRNGKYWK